MLSPEEAFDEGNFQKEVIKRMGLEEKEVSIRPLKRSIDARAKNIKVNISAAVYIDESPPALIEYKRDYPDVSSRPEVIIVGSGPAGIFAGLRCVELGLKPIILERGKDVQSRRRDLAAINKENVVNRWEIVHEIEKARRRKENIGDFCCPRRIRRNFV